MIFYTETADLRRLGTRSGQFQGRPSKNRYIIKEFFVAFLHPFRNVEIHLASYTTVRMSEAAGDSFERSTLLRKQCNMRMAENMRMQFSVHVMQPQAKGVAVIIFTGAGEEQPIGPDAVGEHEQPAPFVIVPEHRPEFRLDVNITFGRRSFRRIIQGVIVFVVCLRYMYIFTVEIIQAKSHGFTYSAAGKGHKMTDISFH